MRVHVTNVYGGDINDRNSAIQKNIAEVGRSLQFNEIGIYRYPVSSDTKDELAKRIDGIIAGIAYGDVAVIQLPTGNGEHFETRFINRIKSSGARVVLLIEDFLPYGDTFNLSNVDIAYAFNDLIKDDCINKGFPKNTISVIGDIHRRSKMEISSKLLSIVSPFFAEEYDTNIKDEENLIHVCFSLHDLKGTYSIEVGVVLKTIIENTTAKVCFHIFIDDTVSFQNRMRLRKISNDGGHVLMFHLIDVERVTVDNENLKAFTIGTMFRLLIPEVLADLNKVIYLDADLVFLKDIKELWDIDISEYSLGAVRDVGVNELGGVTPVVMDGSVDRDKYFNAGVLIMNLDTVRSMGNLAANTIDVLNRYKDSKWPDQDALNYIFSNTTLFISEEWNTVATKASRNNWPLERRVYHYAGQKFLDYEDMKPWDDCYIKVKNSLDWPNDSFILYERFGNMLVHKHKRMGEMIKSSKDVRKKIFFGNRSRALNKLIDMIGLDKKDYFVECSNPDKSWVVKDKENIAKETKGKFIVYVAPDSMDWKAIRYLLDMGLVEDKDFIVIPGILLANDGGYLL